MGIEPTSEAWEASILPLNYARSSVTLPNPTSSCKESTESKPLDEHGLTRIKYRDSWSMDRTFERIRNNNP
jgi:hypothetical protein